ncbi:hypothetical protein [Eubacterium sp.]
MYADVQTIEIDNENKLKYLVTSDNFNDITYVVDGKCVEQSKRKSHTNR